jgi:hypothetical protein
MSGKFIPKRETVIIWIVAFVLVGGYKYWESKKGDTTGQETEAGTQNNAGLEQDQVYNYTNGLIAQIRPLPACVALAQAMRDIASSNAPDYVRERQVNAMFDKIPDACINR